MVSDIQIKDGGTDHLVKIIDCNYLPMNVANSLPLKLNNSRDSKIFVFTCN